MSINDMFFLCDAQGWPEQSIRVHTDERGCVCVSHYDWQGNYEGTIRYDGALDDPRTVDVLDSDGTIVATLSCNEEGTCPTPATA